MACCGTPFSVGDPVAWAVRRDVDQPFLSDAISPEIAASIEFREEHHDEDDERALDARGRVTGILAASCRYAFRDEEGASAPVPGSGALVAVVSSVDRPASNAGADHLGWIVQLGQVQLS